MHFELLLQKYSRITPTSTNNILAGHSNSLHLQSVPDLPLCQLWALYDTCKGLLGEQTGMEIGRTQVDNQTGGNLEQSRKKLTRIWLGI